MAATPFPRTLRALEAEMAHSVLWPLAAAMSLLLGLVAWLFLAEVPIYESTDNARLEVLSVGHTVQSPVPGRVAHAWLELGRHVNAGDALIEIESSGERLALEVERARQAAHEREIETLRRQLSAQEGALLEARRTAGAAIDEARSRADAAAPASDHAANELRRLQALHDSGMMATADLLRRQTEAQQARLAMQSATLAARRVSAEAQVVQRDRLASIARIRHELAVTESQLAISAAQARRLENELARRRIASPVDGTIASRTALLAGSFVDEGDAIATIVPAGRMHAVGEFASIRSLGRIRPGQRARLRLHGFPWAQYGSVAATVGRVAGEERNGFLRVELIIMPHPDSAIPLEHGLAASADVQVESIPPAALLLRAAGRLATAHVASPDDPT